MKRKKLLSTILLFLGVFFACIAFSRRLIPHVSAEVEQKALASLEALQNMNVEAGLLRVGELRESQSAMHSSVQQSIDDSVSADVSEKDADAAIQSAAYESQADYYERLYDELRQESFRALEESFLAESNSRQARSQAFLASREVRNGLRESEAESARASSVQASIEESSRARAAEESRKAAEASRRAAEEAAKAAASRAAAGTKAASGGSSGGSSAATGQVVFVGDSRTAGFIGAGLMPASRCIVYPGACYAWYDNVKKAAALKPSKVVFFGGMNDLGVYYGNDQVFYERYSELIKYFRSLSPGSKIYVNKIIPATQAAINQYPGRAKVNEFNARIQQVCNESGWICIDTSAGFKSEYYTGDGVHFNAPWYPIWFKNLREKVGC